MFLIVHVYVIVIVSVSHMCSSCTCHLLYAEPEIISMHGDSKDWFITVCWDSVGGSMYSGGKVWVRQDGSGGGGWHTASDILSPLEGKLVQDEL